MVPDKARGFTLIEVLIAMVATVMIVTLAFSTFSNIINGFEGLREASRSSHEINRAWTFISRDLRQFVNRPIRDELGELEPSFFGGELAEDSISFTRIGWHNPNRHPRSHMQRVRYRLAEDVLLREVYPVLDRTDETEASEVELLRGVREFTIAFLTTDIPLPVDGYDSEDWPRSWAVGPDQRGLGPPEALEITLDIEGYGRIVRLFELPVSTAQVVSSGG